MSVSGENLPQHPYSRTEATRLLCAGVYLDASFRRRVVGELVGHPERPVPPPLGVDVLPVLAHALRVMRQETTTALLLLAVWSGFLITDVVMFWDALGDQRVGGPDVQFQDVLTAFYSGDEGLKLTGGLPLPWFQLYAMVAVALWFARSVSGRGTDGLSARRNGQVAQAVQGAGRLVRVGAWMFAAFYWYRCVAGVLDGTVQTPYPLIFPLLIALVVWWHQLEHRRALATWLSRWTFQDAVQPPLSAGPLYEDLQDSIRQEQAASLTLYDVDSPFVGAGTPHGPWSFALELKRETQPKGTENGVPHQLGQPLTARSALDMIKPALQNLRESAALSGKDRLRELEIEEFVYLPGGVERDEALLLGSGGGAQDESRPDQRGASVYEPEQVEWHCREAVDEGGEGRRVFLRVRVGAWHEQVVVTVLVRVHTQGGMLVLEVAPYVLGPIHAEFKKIDTLIADLPEEWWRGAVRALRDGPATGLAVGLGAAASFGSEIRTEVANRDPAPDVPRVSLRQVASTQALSPFQEMDVARYIKTIQDRIVNGMRDALKNHGYRTDRFEQHVYQVSGGSVFIGEMSGGAVATGTHGRASHSDSAPDTEGSRA